MSSFPVFNHINCRSIFESQRKFRITFIILFLLTRYTGKLGNLQQFRLLLLTELDVSWLQKTKQVIFDMLSVSQRCTLFALEQPQKLRKEKMKFGIVGCNVLKIPSNVVFCSYLVCYSYCIR